MNNDRVKTGRPLSFDRQRALEAAMLVFWKHGYEGSSVTTLIKAMGITSPSLYTAFGDKKMLFREAVQHYLTRRPTSHELIRTAPTGFEAARRVMQGAAHTYASDTDPPGCLLASSAIAHSDAAKDVGAELSAIRKDIERTLHARLVVAADAGEILPGTDLEALAGSIMATIQGMSTLARDGASRDKLLGIIDMTLSRWPERTTGG